MADTILQLTARGKVLEAKINKGEGTIPFHVTRIVAGAGASTNLSALNNVVDIRQEFSILSSALSSLKLYQKELSFARSD